MPIRLTAPRLSGARPRRAMRRALPVRRTRPGDGAGRTDGHGHGARVGARIDGRTGGRTGIAADERGAGRSRNRSRGRRGDRGVSSLEFAAMLPLLLLVSLAVIQLGIVGYTAQQAGTAARAAARTASQEDTEGQYAAAGATAISDWLADGASFDSAFAEDEVTVTATLTIPSLVPGVGSFGTAARSVTMPRD